LGISPSSIAKITGLFLTALLFAGPALADEIQGKVVKVADGDTVTILDGSQTTHRNRLSGIDAPESTQAYGQASKKNLSRLVAGKMVTIQYSKKDKYGRIIGKIFCGGEDVNLKQLDKGLAWHYKNFQREQPVDEREAYEIAERQAQRSRIGLWKKRRPQPPWEYRRATKNKYPTIDKGKKG
jgi:endonuclease YncB( thermonuclease family)